MSWDSIQKTADAITKIPNYARYGLSWGYLHDFYLMAREGDPINALSKLYNYGFVKGYKAGVKAGKASHSGTK